MKTTSDPIVSIVDESGSSASVPRSAYEKVWAHRGYRLVSDVEAEQAAAEAESEPEATDESAGKTPDSGDAGTPPPPVPGPRGHVNPAS